MQTPEITDFLKVKCPENIFKCPENIFKCPENIFEIPLLLTKGQLYYIIDFEVISMQNKNKDLAENYVVKSNAIIQHARFQLSTQEQKIIAYMCSKINPRKPEQDIITFSVQEFIKVSGIQEQGNIYRAVKTAVDKLASRILWVWISNEEEMLIRWIDRAWINKGSGYIKIRIDPEMKPYLYDLKQRFTQYQLKNVLKMNSRYAIQLFELFKSYEYRKIVSVSVDRLKKFLMVDKIKTYEDFGRFKQQVLTVAINEINKHSDITVSYEVSGKEVRKITELTFFIKRKDNGQQPHNVLTDKAEEPDRSYDISFLDGIGLLD